MTNKKSLGRQADTLSIFEINFLGLFQFSTFIYIFDFGIYVYARLKIKSFVPKVALVEG